MALGEFDLIDRYFRRGPAGGSVILGVGDDGALLRPDPGHDLVAVVDTLVAGVHFPADLDASDIGWRAAAVNLSDIAAMGARPRWATLALTLPAAEDAWLSGFSEGLYTALDGAGATLVGGDTTRGNQRVISLQVMGEVPAGEALRRDGARPGDLLFVSGHPGDAAAGLRRLEAGFDASDPLIRRFRRPEARLPLGQRLRSVASAAIDLSDGLFADVGKLAEASGVGVTLDIDRLPLSAALRAAFPDDAVRFALAGGDDYELAFAVPSESETAIAGLGETLGVSVTAIGSFSAGDGIECRSAGQTVEFDMSGFDHFTEAS